MMTSTPSSKTPTRQLIWLALALSTGAALSLGITRFSYGLLLPPMRSDLGWSYTLAGAMNTVNALGYLLGALLTPRLLQRFGAARVLLVGAVLASGFMGLSGFFTGTAPLLLQRLLAGMASALVFIAGGLLAARLGALQPARGGFLIGVYYGGTGFGIVLSALRVPVVLGGAETFAPGLGRGLLGAGAGVLCGDGCAAVASALARAFGTDGAGDRCRAGCLHLASVCLCIGGLCHVRRRLHRLHDFRGCAVARAGCQ